MMNQITISQPIIIFTTIGIGLSVLVFVAYMYRKWIREKLLRSNTEPNVVINRQISPVGASDKTYPLRDYYILTSYNTCISGPYDSGVVSIQNLRNALYMGFRCLDFEIFAEPKTDNPIVACSTKLQGGEYPIQTGEPMLFSDVMYYITTYAFVSYGASNYTDPLILNLRIKSNSKKLPYTLANLFTKYSKYMVDRQYNIKNMDNFGTVTIPKIMNRISVFVDSVSDNYLSNSQFMQFVNMTTTSKWYSIKTWSDYPQTKYKPTTDTKYTNPQITMVIPDINTIDPPNPEVSKYHSQGCQMVGLMIKETHDDVFTDSLEFFDNNHKSFVLKPDALRYPDTSYIAKSCPPPYNFNAKSIVVPENISSDDAKFSI